MSERDVGPLVGRLYRADESVFILCCGAQHLCFFFSGRQILLIGADIAAVKAVETVVLGGDAVVQFFVLLNGAHLALLLRC
jgi:hypothetical protein